MAVRLLWRWTHLSGTTSVWSVVLLATVIQASAAGITQGLPVLYPFMQAEFDLTRTQVGFITSAVAVGTLVMSLPGGRLTDTWGVRWVGGLALVLVMLPLAGLALSGNLLVLLAFAGIAGTVQAFGYPASSRAILDWLPARTRGLGMSIKQAGLPGAGALAAAVLPAIAVATSWRVAAVALGGLMVVGGIVVLLLYRDRPGTLGTWSGGTLGLMRAFSRSRCLTVAALWACVMASIHFTITTYLVLFLVDEVKMSPVVAAGFLGVAQLVSVGARVAWGVVSDFVVGARRLPVLGVMGVVGAAGLLGTALVGQGTPVPMITLLAVVLGATGMSWTGLLTVLVGESVPAGQAGTAIGSVNVLIRLAVIVLPPLFGLMVDVSGSYGAAWSTAAGLGLAATLVLLLLGREGRR